MDTPPDLFSNLPPFDPEQLTRFLAGQSAGEERRAIERWGRETPEHREQLARLQQAWDIAGKYAQEFQRDQSADDRMVNAVLARTRGDGGIARGLHTTTPISPQEQRRRIETSKSRSSYRVPLVAALVLTFAFVTRRPSLGPETSGNTRTYATTAGQQATVSLPNGSRAVLGPATTLSVLTNAGDRGITITMTGQALFTVTPHDRAPFVIRTSRTTTRVLGTTFSVRQYETDHTAHIAVFDGRVALQGRLDDRVVGSSTVLSARTLGVVDDSGQVHVTPNIVVDDYTAWTTGRLVFRDMPVRDIVLELGRAYGVEIRLADSTLATRVLTWTVPVTQKSLSGALEALSTVLGAHVRQSGNVITVLPGAATSQKLSSPLSSSPPERQYGR